MSNYHVTVLQKETIDLLKVKPEGLYIDATLGGGGHSFEILNRNGKVLALDVDQDALEHAKAELKDWTDLVLVKGNFKDIDKIAKEKGIEKIAGAVFDLGVSSHQIDEPLRGFSFQKDGPLDMRMDRDLSVKAGDLINILTKQELIDLFTKLGEEYKAWAIAQAIVDARKIEPIKTTSQLSEVVRKAVGGKISKINPATKVFQALRIAVNDEVNNLRESLPKVWDLIEAGGRLCVISFHSLEDRVVKNQFKEWEKEGLAMLITKKPVVPKITEVEANNRSRSAKLRVIEKL